MKNTCCGYRQFFVFNKIWVQTADHPSVFSDTTAGHHSPNIIHHRWIVNDSTLPCGPEVDIESAMVRTTSVKEDTEYCCRCRLSDWELREAGGLLAMLSPVRPATEQIEHTPTIVITKGRDNYIVPIYTFGILMIKYVHLVLLGEYYSREDDGHDDRERPARYTMVYQEGATLTYPWLVMHKDLLLSVVTIRVKPETHLPCCDSNPVFHLNLKKHGNNSNKNNDGTPVFFHDSTNQLVILDPIIFPL